ncbi:hypothetical protein CC80DRAFT_427032, partial [Byssothecium circinans]
FILYTARLYKRIGYHLLTVNLSMIVNIYLHIMPTRSSADFNFNPRKLLRRHLSLVDEDNAGRGADSDGEGDRKKEKEKKKPSTQFQEPESSSLLDAFGF